MCESLFVKIKSYVLGTYLLFLYVYLCTGESIERGRDSGVWEVCSEPLSEV